MTVTDQIKIPDKKIKSNQAQYDLGREAAIISALSSENRLEKYEYLTGEDLGYNPSMFEKDKFEHSPLGMVLTNNTKSKTNKNKSYKNKQNTWSIIHSIVLQSLKISMNLKKYHLILCTRDWMTLKKDLICLKLLIHKQMTTKF